MPPWARAHGVRDQARGGEHPSVATAATPTERLRLRSAMLKNFLPRFARGPGPVLRALARGGLRSAARTAARTAARMATASGAPNSTPTRASSPQAWCCASTPRMALRYSAPRRSLSLRPPRQRQKWPDELCGSDRPKSCRAARVASCVMRRWSQMMNFELQCD